MTSLTGRTCHLLRAEGTFSDTATSTADNHTEASFVESVGAILKYRHQDNGEGASKKRERRASPQSSLSNDEIFKQTTDIIKERVAATAYGEIPPASTLPRTNTGLYVGGENQGAAMDAYFATFMSICNASHPLHRISKDTLGCKIDVGAGLRSVNGQVWFETLCSQLGNPADVNRSTTIANAERVVEKHFAPLVEAAWFYERSNVGDSEGVGDSDTFTPKSTQEENNADDIGTLEPVLPNLYRYRHADDRSTGIGGVSAANAGSFFVAGSLDATETQPSKQAAAPPSPARRRSTVRISHLERRGSTAPMEAAAISSQVPALVYCWGTNKEAAVLVRQATSVLHEAVSRLSLRCTCRVPYVTVFSLAGVFYTVSVLVTLAADTGPSTTAECVAATSLLNHMLSTTLSSSGQPEDRIAAVQMPTMQWYSGLDGHYYLLAGRGGTLTSPMKRRQQQSSLLDYMTACSRVCWEPRFSKTVQEAFAHCTKVGCELIDSFATQERRINPATELISTFFVPRILQSCGLDARMDVCSWHSYVMDAIADATTHHTSKVSALRRLETVISSEMLLLALLETHHLLLSEFRAIRARFIHDQRAARFTTSIEEEGTLAPNDSAVISTDASLAFKSKDDELTMSSEDDDEHTIFEHSVLGHAAKAKDVSSSLTLLALNYTMHLFVYNDNFSKKLLPDLLKHVFPQFGPSPNVSLSLANGSTIHSSFFVSDDQNSTHLLPFGDILIRIQRLSGATFLPVEPFLERHPQYITNRIDAMQGSRASNVASFARQGTLRYAPSVFGHEAALQRDRAHRFSVMQELGRQDELPKRFNGLHPTCTSGTDPLCPIPLPSFLFNAFPHSKLSRTLFEELLQGLQKKFEQSAGTVANSGGGAKTHDINDVSTWTGMLCFTAAAGATISQELCEAAFGAIAAHLNFVPHIAVMSGRTMQSRQGSNISGRLMSLFTALSGASHYAILLLNRRGAVASNTDASQNLLPKTKYMLRILEDNIGARGDAALGGSNSASLASSTREGAPDMRFVAHQMVIIAKAKSQLDEHEDPAENDVSPLATPPTTHLSAPLPSARPRSGSLSGGSPSRRSRTGSVRSDNLTTPIATSLSPMSIQDSQSQRLVKLFLHLSETESTAGTFDKKLSSDFLQVFIGSADNNHIDESIALCAGNPQRAVEHSTLLLRKATIIAESATKKESVKAKRDARMKQTEALLVLLPVCGYPEGRTSLRRSSSVLAELELTEGRHSAFDPNHQQLANEAQLLRRRLMHSPEVERELQSWSMVIPVYINLSKLLQDLRKYHDAFFLAQRAVEVATVAYQAQDTIRLSAEEQMDLADSKRHQYCVDKVKRHLRVMMRRWAATYRKREDEKQVLIEQCRVERKAISNSRYDELFELFHEEQRATLEAQRQEREAMLLSEHEFVLRELGARVLIALKEGERRHFVVAQVRILQDCREALRLREMERQVVENEEHFSRLEIITIEFSAMAELAYQQYLVLGICRLAEDGRKVVTADGIVFKKIASEHYVQQHLTLLTDMREMTSLSKTEDIERFRVVRQESIRFHLDIQLVLEHLQEEEAAREVVEEDESNAFFYLSRSIMSMISSHAFEEAIEFIDLQEYDSRAKMIKADAAFWSHLRQERKLTFAEMHGRSQIIQREHSDFYDELLQQEVRDVEFIQRRVILDAYAEADAPLQALTIEPRHRLKKWLSTRREMLADIKEHIMEMERAGRREIRDVFFVQSLDRIKVEYQENARRCDITRRWQNGAVSLQLEVLGIRTATTSLLYLHKKRYDAWSSLLLLNLEEVSVRAHLFATVYLKGMQRLRRIMNTQGPRMKIMVTRTAVRKKLSDMETINFMEAYTRHLYQRSAYTNTMLLWEAAKTYSFHVGMEAIVGEGLRGAIGIVLERQRRVETDFSITAASLKYIATFTSLMQRELADVIPMQENYERLNVLREEGKSYARLENIFQSIVACISTDQPTCDTEAMKRQRDLDQLAALQRAALHLREQDSRSDLHDLWELEMRAFRQMITTAEQEEQQRLALCLNDADGIRRLRYDHRPDLTLSWLTMTARVRKFIRTVATDEDNEQYQRLCLHPPTKIDLEAFTVGDDPLDMIHYLGKVQSLAEIAEDLPVDVTPTVLVEWNRAVCEQLVVRLLGDPNPASAASVSVMKDEEIATMILDVPLRSCNFISVKMKTLRGAAHVANNQVLFEADEVRQLFISAMLSGSAARLMSIVDRETAAGRIFAVQKDEENARLEQEELLQLQQLEAFRRSFLEHRELTNGSVPLMTRHAASYFEVVGEERTARVQLEFMETEGVPRAAMLKEYRQELSQIKKLENLQRPPRDCSKLYELHRLAADMSYRSLDREPSFYYGSSVFLAPSETPPSKTSGLVGLGGGRQSSVQSVASSIATPLAPNANSLDRMKERQEVALKACAEEYPALTQLIAFTERDETVFRSGVSRANILRTAIHDEIMIWEECSTEWMELTIQFVLSFHEQCIEDWREMQAFGAKVVEVLTVVLNEHRRAVQAAYTDSSWALKRLALERDEARTRRVVERGEPEQYGRLIEQFKEDASIILMIAEIRESAAGDFVPQRQRFNANKTNMKRAAITDGDASKVSDLSATEELFVSSRRMQGRSHTRPSIEIRESVPVKPLTQNSTFAQVYDAAGGDAKKIQQYFDDLHPPPQKVEAMHRSREAAEFIHRRSSQLQTMYTTQVERQGIFVPANAPFSAAKANVALGPKRIGSAGPKSRSITPGPQTAVAPPKAAVVGRLRPSTATQLRPTKK